MNEEPKSPSQELQEKIAAHRVEQAARRARAFIDCPDRVLGISIKNLTPATWTMLHATNSRFVVPNGPPLEGDIRNYLWFHSRLFTTGFCARPLKWCALLRFSAILHAKRDSDYYCATLVLAAMDIKRILYDALADAPTGGRKDGRAAGACLEAQLITLMGGKLQWSEEKVKRTPLARLMQLRRCLVEDDGDDPVEYGIKMEHLRKRNEELAPERARMAALKEGKPETVTAP